MQDCSNSTANALELLQPCSKPSKSSDVTNSEKKMNTTKFPSHKSNYLCCKKSVAMAIELQLPILRTLSCHILKYNNHHILDMSSLPVWVLWYYHLHFRSHLFHTRYCLGIPAHQLFVMISIHVLKSQNWSNPQFFVTHTVSFVLSSVMIIKHIRVQVYHLYLSISMCHMLQFTVISCVASSLDHRLVLKTCFCTL